MLSSLCLSILAVGLFQNGEAWVPLSAKKRILTSLFSSATNNNVVLRPSEDPEAFDSCKIGSARVHRYLRDDLTSGSSAEYVMWFHGRSKDIEDDQSLPPLSTGRIGRATSLNGLQWEKTTEGSLAEDVSDVSLGLNKESWWGFDTSHVGLGQVRVGLRKLVVRVLPTQFYTNNSPCSTSFSNSLFCCSL